MPTLAVYIVPRKHEYLYKVGTAFLGYDVRTGTRTVPLLADTVDQATLDKWLGQAPIFGFHATIGDALHYTDDVVPEVILRLEWIARRTPPFALIRGRFHDTARYVPNALTITFDTPDETLHRLHYLVVTMVNVLYCSSPFYQPRSDTLSEDDRLHLIRYGVPHFRILDQFDLHFALATSIPNRQAWEQLHATMVQKTNLFCQVSHRILKVDEIYLLEQWKDGYFRIIAAFPLIGNATSYPTYLTS